MADPNKSGNIALEEILRTNLSTVPVPTVPRYAEQPGYGQSGIQEIERRKAELQKVRSAAERGKEDIGRFEEAGGMLKRQLQEEAAYQKERGLLDIERGRPIPKELPEFVPPKQTFDELFSMLMVGIGTGTGAGRGNYMIAANAMIGAMEGYQKGKKDQLNNAIKEFDIAVKRAAQEEKINIARYNQIVNDKKLTLGEKIRQISIQANAVDDKIMAAKTRRGSLDEVLKEINRQETALTSFEEKRLKAEQDLANEMRRRQERKEDKEDARAAAFASRAPQLVEIMTADGKKEVRDLNQIKFDKSGRPVLGEGETLLGKAGGKADEERLKVTADVEKRIDSAVDSVTGMTKVLEATKDEDLRKKWQQGSTQISRFLAEYNPGRGQEDSLFSRFVREKSMDRLDPKVRDLVITIMQARNDYYKQKNGTAVSGSEASRSFGAVIQPTDSLDVLASKARNAGEGFAEKLDTYSEDYVLGKKAVERLKNTAEKFRKSAQTDEERLRELEAKRGGQ